MAAQQQFGGKPWACLVGAASLSIPRYSFVQRVMEQVDCAADVAEAPAEPGSLRTWNSMCSAFYPPNEGSRGTACSGSHPPPACGTRTCGSRLRRPMPLVICGNQRPSGHGRTGNLRPIARSPSVRRADHLAVRGVGALAKNRQLDLASTCATLASDPTDRRVAARKRRWHARTQCAKPEPFAAV